jgi:hypothetical protein
MKATDAAQWMQEKLVQDGCIYQDAVVDHLVKAGADDLLRENADGNLVLGRKLLEAFRALNEDSVVWVKPERYWRPRVAEDEAGRDARG